LGREKGRITPKRKEPVARWLEALGRKKADLRQKCVRATNQSPPHQTKSAVQVLNCTFVIYLTYSP